MNGPLAFARGSIWWRAFLFGGLALAIFLRATFTTVVVEGESMLPAFREGTRLVVSRAYWLVGGLHRQDVIVLHNVDSGELNIKRIHRLAGQAVEWRNVPEEWSIAKGPLIVPPGHVYVLGDNKGVSVDSRQYGPVPLHAVVGKVVQVR